MLKIIFKLLLSATAFVFAIVLYIESEKHDTKLLAPCFVTFGIFLFALIDLWEFCKAKHEKKEELLLIKNRIRENLISDSEKLEVLIPLLEDETHKNSIDNTFKIEGPTDLLLDYLHGLISSPKSKIVNEPKIELIRKWLNLRESTNKQMSLYSRVDFIKENKHELRTTIRKLIRLFE